MPVTIKSQFVRLDFRRVAKRDIQTFAALEAQFAAHNSSGECLAGPTDPYCGDYLDDKARFLFGFAVRSVPATFTAIYETSGERPFSLFFPIPTLDEKYLTSIIFNKAIRRAPDHRSTSR